MKNNQKSHFIPVFTSETGSCLTLANWQEVGVDKATYDLTSLLMKPGFELLSTLPDLKSYTGWSKNLFLNAAMPKMGREGDYTLRSIYDGSRKRYTQDELLKLIVQLKPHFVLLPEGMGRVGQALPENIMPFFAPDDLPTLVERAHGVYFFYDTAMPFSGLVQKILKYKDIPCYVGGELSLSLMLELANIGVEYIASDVPARDACLGTIYCKEADFLLKDDAQRLSFALIDEKCTCPTCEQQLTRAYLHHLLEHTPLLCQRFLIQHNVNCARLAITRS